MSKLQYGCEGLCAVISGGTSGIGLEVAKCLLLDGARVYILGRSRLRGARAVDYLKQEAGADAVFVACDVASQKQCAEAMAQITACEKKQDWQLDILVNSAGVYKEQGLEQLTEEDFSSMMSVNVQGTMLLTQAALPYLHSGSCVVNVASDAGINGNYGCPLYCASKGAVVALTRALALDLAPEIRVNCVCPADVDTPLLAKQLIDTEGGYTLADMAAAYPLQRVAAASEVAHVICSIASPANSFMTGSIVTVDGGLTAG